MSEQTEEKTKQQISNFLGRPGLRTAEGIIKMLKDAGPLAGDAEQIPTLIRAASCAIDLVQPCEIARIKLSQTPPSRTNGRSSKQRPPKMSPQEFSKPVSCNIIERAATCILTHAPRILENGPDTEERKFLVSMMFKAVANLKGVCAHTVLKNDRLQNRMRALKRAEALKEAFPTIFDGSTTHDSLPIGISEKVWSKAFTSAWQIKTRYPEIMETVLAGNFDTGNHDGIFREIILEELTAKQRYQLFDLALKIRQGIKVLSEPENALLLSDHEKVFCRDFMEQSDEGLRFVVEQGLDFFKGWVDPCHPEHDRHSINETGIHSDRQRVFIECVQAYAETQDNPALIVNDAFSQLYKQATTENERSRITKMEQRAGTFCIPIRVCAVMSC